MKTWLAISLSSAVSLLWISGSQAGAPCSKTTFETKLVADACKAGGVTAAKDAMKRFVKQAKSNQPGLECASCHSKMAPSYELKPDGLAAFKKLGGQ